MNDIIALLRKPVFVREHGTWAILTIPIITGISHATHVGSELFYFLIAVFFLFFAYRPAEILFTEIKNKRNNSLKFQSALLWLFIYSSFGLAGGAYLVFGLHLIILIWFLLLALLFFAISISAGTVFKSVIVRDVTAILGLTLNAPAVYYILENRINASSAVLWLCNAVFFISSALYIHMKMLQQQKPEQSAKGLLYQNKKRLNLTYQLALTIILAACVNIRLLTPVALLAFIPMLLHCVIGTFIVQPKVNFKKIGYTLLAYSLFFGFLLKL